MTEAEVEELRIDYLDHVKRSLGRARRPDNMIMKSSENRVVMEFLVREKQQCSPADVP